MSKGTVGSALNFLAGVLNSEKICINTKPLKDAAGELISRKDAAGFWGYNLQKLVFKDIEIPRGTIPSDVSSLTVVLNVEIHEKSYHDRDIFNPIIVDKKKGIEKNYNFSIEIFGYVDDGKNINKVLSYWHLDYDSSEENEYLHPDFHLTYGGKVMSKIDLGHVLLLPSPRLSHPPMDAVLGIDFIIRNFIRKDKSRNIINNSQYQKIIKASQYRLWRPYILSTARHWCNFSGCNFNTDIELSKRFFPSLES